MIETEEILDKIRAASKFGYSNKGSIVDNLLKRGWCRESDLLFAYDDFQKSEGDRVTVSFQVPFPMSLPENTWIKVRSEFGHPYLACASLSFESNQDNSIPDRTQVFISYQLWNTRRDFYPLYLQGLETNQKSIKTNLRSEGEWNLQEFEHDVAKRLWLQSREVLKEFIPLYKVIFKDTRAYPPQDLRQFFIMVKNGRVVCRNLDENKVTDDKTLLNSKTDSNGNLSVLKKRIKENIPPSIYETYFLEVRRLIETENYDLAVVQTIVILDWFANEIIESHLISKIKKSLGNNSLLFKLTYERIWEKEKNQDIDEKDSKKKGKSSNIRVKTTEKFIKYFPTIGINLSSKLVGSLRNINEIRNEIVHHYKTNFVGKDVANEALETGMEIVHFSIKQLVTNLKKNEQLSISEK